MEEIKNNSCPIIDKVIGYILKDEKEQAINKLEELRELTTQCEKDRDSNFKTIVMLNNLLKRK